MLRYQVYNPWEHKLPQQHHREFFGFNRAKHAVLEAAILATRVELLPADEILSELHGVDDDCAMGGSGCEDDLGRFASLES